MQIRTVFFIAVLWIALSARENPFFPAPRSSAPNYTSNHIKKPEPFRSVTIKLPDSVRILESVTLTCKNLDGSITKKEIPINKAVDWHDKIVIFEQKRVLSTQVCKSTKRKRIHFKKIAQLGFISFSECGKELRIATKDKLLRNFKLLKPERVVLDFKRNADFRTYTFTGAGVFKKITIGNHNGYYRAVIELDGHYLHHIRPLREGYLLILE